MKGQLLAHTISFPGAVLERGFWLYVVEVRGPEASHLYVGRTGDSSSPHAGSPFSRIGQHLDVRANAKGNALGRNLRAAGVDPGACVLQMIAIGPLFPEQADFEAHRPVRDLVGALEAGLAQALRKKGHTVLGKHPPKGSVDEGQLANILGLVEERLNHHAA